MTKPSQRLERKNVDEREVRSYALQIKAAGEDGTIEGYGSVFGNKDSYNDVIEKGAFAQSIKSHKASQSMPAMLWQHDAAQPIGVWTDISEDENGLHMRGKFAMGTVKGREAYELAKMHALNGLSIGFVAKGWDYSGEVRILTELELWEVSLVTFPANTKARITGVKSSDEIVTLKDAERVLRDSGFSKQDALAFVSRVKTLSSRSDSDDMGELKASLMALQSKLS
jgi:HK97 family phage prohead protease